MSKEKKKKKRQDDFVDDGHTVANMNVEGFRWYKSDAHKELQGLNLTGAERWAIIRGAFKAFIVPFLIFLGSMILVYFLLRWWLLSKI